MSNELENLRGALEGAKEIVGNDDLPTLNNEENISGIVVNTEEVLQGIANAESNVRPAACSEESLNNIDEYIAELDETIDTSREEISEEFGYGVADEIEEADRPNDVQAVRKRAMKNYEEEDEDGEESEIDMSDEEIAEEIKNRYKEAIVVIDKTNMGIVEFTEEERAKLEKVSKIKLQEVEEIELNNITIKKGKNKKRKLTTILNRTKNTLKTSDIVLPVSGYTATIRGCSSYELLELANRNPKDAILDNENKWSLIYNKIESTSIGKFKDFNDFLSKTSTMDYNIFIYGILCATYPDVDTVPLTCQKCNKEFDHRYDIKSLIRAEELSSGLLDLITSTVDNSYDLKSAIEHHESSPINIIKRYQLPVSGIIVDLCTQSVYDFIYNSLKKLDKKEEKYAQASMISTAVSAFYILDEEDGEYDEIDKADEITDIIYALGDIDMKVLNLKMQDVLGDNNMKFGFMDMNCPHCRNHVPSLPMDVEKILFFKYQKALNTEIE